ncbi:hypothetical protein [Yoonia sp.]|uniref:hypothetical protein n=1 Tax=Yoonia sp. TaxID=2212373 RepID=UPI0025E43DC7|nr:hypothetical protein [Yoonia sp.]
MQLSTLVVILASIAGQAAALSCVQPAPIATFQRVAAAPDAYFVLYGDLTFDEGALPPAVSNRRTTDPAPIPARFRGKGLTLDGFTSDYISPATLQVSCAGPWCGTARSGGDALYFVRADSDPVTMQAEPCGGMIFQDPSQAVLDALTSCMRGDTCSAQPFK